MTKFEKDERNPNWKGENANIANLHNYVRRRKSKPALCEICHKRPSLDLMNKNHIYSRNPEDYLWVCRSCHLKYDGGRTHNKLKGRTWEDIYGIEEAERRMKNLKERNKLRIRSKFL